jgi:hypothetical protein
MAKSPRLKNVKDLSNVLIVVVVSKMSAIEYMNRIN